MKCLMKAKNNQPRVNTQNSITVCDECSYEFLTSSIEIKETSVIINGKTFILEYFTCPKCDKIYRIILKDDRYEELKLDLENTKARIRKNNGRKNEEFARVLNDMVFKKLERLRMHTQILNKKFPGTFTFVVSENNNKEKIIKYLP